MKFLTVWLATASVTSAAYDRGPLSPFLFILAMEPLQQLIAMAVDDGLLSRLPGQANGVRTSLYADDAVFFIRPVKEELEAIRQILQRFGDVTGSVLTSPRLASSPSDVRPWTSWT
jgi:hypothetical protein